MFIAIDPPDEVREELCGLCRGVEGARWVPREQLHVTLRFLGEVPEGAVGRIAAALESIREEEFSAAFAGVGRFPPRRAPRVIWAGTEPAGRFAALHDRIEERLRETGIPADEKAFSPHLTLARLREGASRSQVETWLGSWSGFRSSPFAVSRFFLYSSLLGPAGARHTRERTYELEGGAP